MPLNRLETLRNHHKVILEVYNEHNLESIRNIEGEFLVNGQNILLRFANLQTRSLPNQHNVDFQKLFNEIVNCSDEILYFVANALLYQEYINNPLNESITHYGTVIYPNNENVPARRFHMMLDSSAEKFYNYWDKIGDLLWAVFPTSLTYKRVYFGSVVSELSSTFSDQNLGWLKQFVDTDYAKINSIRKGSVHNYSIGTDFRHNHIYLTTRQEVQDLIDERNSKAEFFKQQVKIAIDGFDKTLTFIESNVP